MRREFLNEKNDKKIIEEVFWDVEFFKKSRIYFQNAESAKSNEVDVKSHSYPPWIKTLFN